MNAKILGPIGLRAFEQRKISEETAVRFGIYTARAAVDEAGRRNGEVEPDPNGNVVAFPFHEGGRVVAEKYRAPNKQFWQRKGGKRTFYNADILDDPALEQGSPLIITEGEIDALTAIDCGFPFTVSVPDGAPAVKDGEDPAELPPADPKAERTGKFEYIWANRDKLKRVRKFILAVDNDAPGKRLEAELLRRLAPSRCCSIAYPEGCKDLSDVRVKHGAEAVARCLNAAKPYPVRGLYRLTDYPDVGNPETFSIGYPDLEELIKVWLGELIIITGIPSHGKSTIVLNILVRLAEMHGWSSAIASFEIQTVPSLRHKLRLMRTRLAPDLWRRDMIADADAWINEHFLFIDDDPTGEVDEDLSLEWLLDRAYDAVLRDGVRVLVIDPWNEVEHSRPRAETETEYHNRALRMIRRFALRHQVVAIVIAHPTKEVGKDGSTRMPTLYDISGSAAWYNKPDHGIVIYVPDESTKETVVSVKKVRFGWSGRKGDVTLTYDPATETYSSLYGQAPLWKALRS